MRNLAQSTHSGIAARLEGPGYRRRQACLLLLFASLATWAWAEDKPAAPPALPAGHPGTVITLQQDGKPFTGIYTEDSTGKNRGAALIVPELNMTADARELVAPLRSRLPKGGWTTLAFDMPVVGAAGFEAAYTAMLSDVGKRLQAGLEFLNGKNVQTIIVVGYGAGAVAAAKYLAATPDPKIVGFVAIGIHVPPAVDAQVNLAADLAKLKIAVLDLYGGRDLRLVRVHADARRDTLRKTDRTLYTRVEIKDAQHNFIGMDDFLVNRLRGWMNRTAASRAPAAPP